MSTSLSISFTPAPPDSALGHHLLGLYFAELQTSLPGGFDPSGQESYGPDEYYVAALHEGQAIGYCGYRPLGPSDAEIKKLWVSPDFRGMDVANRLMAHVEQQAARDGFTRALLDTSDLLTHAVGLYEHRGYHRIDRYNENPYATLFFAKALGTAPGR
ncbi:GNAT family N-acetyltransferase [Propionibacterium freudenreichii]|uniref:GNAT family N-acetyltransferase n=1 Tax=Propionibacterium freudenreichii TaxID=1744 RepID=UPI003853D8AF